MWRVLVVILLLALIGFIALAVIESLYWWGYFQITHNNAYGTDGTCRKLDGTEWGSEDLHLIQNPDGLVFISSGMRTNENSTEGKIVTFKMSTPQNKPVTLQIEDFSNFKLVKPQGMSSWTDPKSRSDVHLYVISHPEDGDVVDKFLYNDGEPTKLKHERRIGNESNFIALNDLAVVGKDKFYFTNDRDHSYIPLVANFAFRLPSGSIGFYDGNSTRLVKKDLFYPNGLALSDDNTFLYVGMTGAKEIRIYLIKDDNELLFNTSIEVKTSVDNLFVDPSKNIWFAAMPILHQAVDYLKCPEESTSPSQVMRIKMKSKSKWEADNIDEVYFNNGTEISGSSSVVVFGSENDMLIGSTMTAAYHCKK